MLKQQKLRKRTTARAKHRATKQRSHHEKALQMLVVDEDSIRSEVSTLIEADVQNSKSFTHGPLQRCRGSRSSTVLDWSVNRGVLRFMDLSKKLRETIYELVVVTSQTFNHLVSLRGGNNAIWPWSVGKFAVEFFLSTIAIIYSPWIVFSCMISNASRDGRPYSKGYRVTATRPRVFDYPLPPCEQPRLALGLSVPKLHIGNSKFLRTLQNGFLLHLYLNQNPAYDPLGQCHHVPSRNKLHYAQF